MTDQDLRDKAEHGRTLIREAMARQKDIVEDKMETEIANKMERVLEAHGVKEENLDHEMIERKAKNMRRSLESDYDDIQELQQVRSDLSFMPHVRTEVFGNMEEEQED